LLLLKKVLNYIRRRLGSDCIVMRVARRRSVNLPLANSSTLPDSSGIHQIEALAAAKR